MRSLARSKTIGRMSMSMTANDAMLNLLLDTLEDSAAGYGYVAEEADSFDLFAHCDFQAFERRRLAGLLASRMAASGWARTPPNKAAATDSGIVNLRIARAHGDAAMIGRLQRTDARFSHMLQASLVDGGLRGEIALTVLAISDAISNGQAELSTIIPTGREALAAETQAFAQA
jgi:hypothetical protein